MPILPNGVSKLRNPSVPAEMNHCSRSKRVMTILS